MCCRRGAPDLTRLGIVARPPGAIERDGKGRVDPPSTVGIGGEAPHRTMCPYSGGSPRLWPMRILGPGPTTPHRDTVNKPDPHTRPPRARTHIRAGGRMSSPQISDYSPGCSLESPLGILTKVQFGAVRGYLGGALLRSVNVSSVSPFNWYDQDPCEKCG